MAGGQGTIALELLSQLPSGQLDAVFVPVGGGGLISGISSVCTHPCPLNSQELKFQPSARAAVTCSIIGAWASQQVLRASTRRGLDIYCLDGWICGRVAVFACSLSADAPCLWQKGGVQLCPSSLRSFKFPRQSSYPCTFHILPRTCLQKICNRLRINNDDDDVGCVMHRCWLRCGRG